MVSENYGFGKIRFQEKIQIRKYEVPTTIFGIYGFSSKYGLRKKTVFGKKTVFRKHGFWKLRFSEITVLGKTRIL